MKKSFDQTTFGETTQTHKKNDFWPPHVVEKCHFRSSTLSSSSRGVQIKAKFISLRIVRTWGFRKLLIGTHSNDLSFVSFFSMSRPINSAADLPFECNEILCGGFGRESTCFWGRSVPIPECCILSALNERAFVKLSAAACFRLLVGADGNV